MPDLMEQLDQAIDMLLRGGQPSASDPVLSGLTTVAEGLRHLPDDRFRTRLIRELVAEFQRRPGVTTSTFNESTGAEEIVIRTITPFICVPDGIQMIEFMKQTFGAVETHRHPHGTDGFVASVRIGNSDLLVMGGESMRGQETSAALHVYVKDCDATYQRARELGALTIGSVGEPADRPYGERAAFISDPFHNTWFIATRFGSEYVGPGLQHVTPCLLPVHASTALEFLKRAFGAKAEGLHEVGGRMVHAFVRIGQVMVEMAEAAEEPTHPLAFYLHTEDVDELHRRAVAAGARSLLAPADQPFGERLAILADPAGNRWMVAKRIVAG
jgi:PhnB protein